MKQKILIIGAGITGLTLARLFKDNGDYVEIREKENFIGGLARDYKYRDFYVNKFGPKILHFSKKTEGALKFIKKYTTLIPYNHKVIALGNSNFTYWPINKSYSKLFKLLNPNSNIYHEFIESYSRKIWGCNMKEVLKNIRVRVNIKNNFNVDFFENQQTFMPAKGYCNLFKNLSKNIKIIYKRKENIESIYGELYDWNWVIVCAPIDDFFCFKFGNLYYTKIKFDFKTINNDGTNILLSPVMNLNTHLKFIRISEYNQFYKSKNKNRIIGLESVNEKGPVCYPILTSENMKIFKKYLIYSKNFENLRFIGRLAEYKYKNFDEACQNAINLFNTIH